MGESVRVRVVLMNPKNSRNVGAVCRAMKTMGLTDLTVVGGRSIDRTEAVVLAVHAADLLERANWTDSLEAAVQDAVLVAGITRRRGKKRKYFSLSSEELAEKIDRDVRGLTAVVFGNEESGLTDRELACCNLAVHVHTSPLFPSLNLSHAVQIVAYDLFRRTLPRKDEVFTSLSQDGLNSLLAEILTSLKDIGFFKQVGPEEMGVFLRDILARAQLSVGEARRLESIFKKIYGLVNNTLDRNPV